MDDATKIAMIKRMSGESDEATIEDYLIISKSVILDRAYPFGYADDLEVPARYDSLQVEIVVELLNKRGAEGEVANSQGGVSRTYENSYVSERLLSRILPAPCVFNVGGSTNETSET